MLYHCAAGFHGLHIRLISLPVIISFGGFLKAKAYIIRPWTIHGLKIAIQKQISAIPENMVGQALGNL
jgi:hypothetical protein